MSVGGEIPIKPIIETKAKEFALVVLNNESVPIGMHISTITNDMPF